MPVLTSPRDRFLKHPKAVEAHLALVGAPEFRTACDTALLQFIHALPPATDAATRAHMIDGAREFIRTLFTLGDVPLETTSRTPIGRLDPNA